LIRADSYKFERKYRFCRFTLIEDRKLLHQFISVTVVKKAKNLPTVEQE
jgi:hypothetical protein